MMRQPTLLSHHVRTQTTPPSSLPVRSCIHVASDGDLSIAPSAVYNTLRTSLAGRPLIGWPWPHARSRPSS
jgi:hypothetical protein